MRLIAEMVCDVMNAYHRHDTPALVKNSHDDRSDNAHYNTKTYRLSIVKDVGFNWLGNRNFIILSHGHSKMINKVVNIVKWLWLDWVYIYFFIYKHTVIISYGGILKRKLTLKKKNIIVLLTVKNLFTSD